MKTAMQELKDKIQHAIEELNSELSEYQAGYKQCLINIQNDIDFQMLQMEKDQSGYSEEDVIKIVEKSRETGLTAEYLLLTFKSE
jgi:hypothetical protein